MSYNIRPGDVVVKVGGEFLLGKIGRVVSIREGCFSRKLGRPCRGLVVSGFPKPPSGAPDYIDHNFRKIPSATEEFTEQMRALRPAKQEQPA